jgi:hypothetical protein
MPLSGMMEIVDYTGFLNAIFRRPFMDMFVDLHGIELREKVANAV